MDNSFLNFYRGKRVFITGHTGFKGAWMADWLSRLGAVVTGYSLPPETRPNLFSMIRPQLRLRHFEGDVGDRSRMSKIIRQARPEIVFHLAAQALVRRSYGDPVETYRTNVMGTAHLIDSIRSVESVRSVVIVTSDKCYENVGWNYGYRETDALGGYDPYSSSKACAELVTSSFRRSFFGKRVGLASARAGNVIGGGDWSMDRIVPDCVRSFSKGRPVLVRNPGATRPWQHVLDPLAGYLLLGRRLFEKPLEFARGWNFGPEHSGSLSVLQLVQKLAKEWGKAEFRLDTKRHPHEAAQLRLDISQSRSLLGWRPVWNAGKAIEATVEWYKAYLLGKNHVVNVMNRQFDDFQEDMRGA